MERHPKSGTRRINNPFPVQPSGLGFVEGNLVFNAQKLPSQSYAVGQGFEVRWVAENGGSLAVYHTSEPKRVLWETIPGKSFVSSASGRDSFEESRGSFAIHDQVEIVCGNQTVEQISLAWPSEILMLSNKIPDRPSQLVAEAQPGHLEKLKTLNSELFPRVDADGVSVGNTGPCLILLGCLYEDPTIARQQLSAFCNNSFCGPKKLAGPFYVAAAQKGWWRKGKKGACLEPFSKESSFGVRYWFLFYETRENQLAFSVSLDRSAAVDSGPHPVGNRTNVVPVCPICGPDIERFNDQRRHWLWSDAPLSAFSPISVAAPDRAPSKVAASTFRRSISVNDFRTDSLESRLTASTNLNFLKPSDFLSHDGDQLPHGPRFNRVQITYSTNREEKFFGFGEQFSHFNVKGRRVPILVQEQGIGRGDQPVTALANLVSNRSGGDWHTTYAPSPYYMTSQMRSLFLEGYEYAVFDLRRHDAVQVQVHARSMSGRILHGRSPAHIIELYTAATGRMRELPAWILKGAIVGMQGGLQAVQRVWQQLRVLEIPIAAFWLQDWVGQRRTSAGWQLWWNWEVDRDHYPGWEELVREFRSNGIRTMAYCNPLLAPTQEKSNRKRDLLNEAHCQGFVVENKFGAPYMIPNTSFEAAMVDLTNPAARTWMKSILHDMVQTGIRGWMADFGEALPLDSSLFSGENPRVVHNKYPELWAELNREFVEDWEAEQREAVKTRALQGSEDDELQDSEEKLVFFTRAGYRESPRWSTLFWEGDQMVSWQRNDGIKSAVTGLLTGGLCGYSLNHSDIGGYCTIDIPLLRYRRTEELLLRWMELNAFSTIFRTHEGNVPGANSQFYSNERTLRHFSRFARMYKAWEFYRRHLVKEASTTGLPVVRHLFLHYPQDVHVQTFTYQQFLVGSEILVVPVLEKGQTRVEAYFPSGEADESWYHIWTGKVYKSSPGKSLKAWVDAPLGKPAVFTRQGSSISQKFIENLVSDGMLQVTSTTLDNAANSRISN